jgi:hypothetical protein
MAQGLPAPAPLTLGRRMESNGRAHESPEQRRPRAALTETLATLSRPVLCPARPWRLEDPAERTAPEDFLPATGDELVAGEPFPTNSPLFLSLYSLSHRWSPSRERRKSRRSSLPLRTGHNGLVVPSSAQRPAVSLCSRRESFPFGGSEGEAPTTRVLHLDASACRCASRSRGTSAAGDGGVALPEVR